MRGLLLNVAALLLTGKSASAIDSKPLLQYEINLDLPPGERYAGLLDVSPVFNDTVWEFYNEYFRDNHHLTDLLYSISAQRGPESDEQQAEIESLASLSGLPLPFVQSIQVSQSCYSYSLSHNVHRIGIVIPRCLLELT